MAGLYRTVCMAVCVACLSGVWLRASDGPAGADERYRTGAFVAAFVTPSEILLCSDGRVVSADDGSIVSDQWSHVHRLSDGIGLLTAGRDLPGVIFTIAGDLSRRRSFGLAEAVAAAERHLQRAWASLPVGPDGRAAGRTVVFLAGFDERGRPRLFRFDSEDQPTFQSREVPLFDRNRQMEIAAIATTGALDPNVSSLIVERLEQVERQAPAIGRQRQFVTAFNDVKAELASSHAHVGGQTFVTTVAPATAP